jgi:hypothetical protein
MTEDLIPPTSNGLVMDGALMVINELEQDGVIGKYAIGGAVALLFYTEPVLTFDLDIFCHLPSQGILINLQPLFDWTSARGYKAESEYINIEGVAVQFLPSTGPLVDEALENAVGMTFAGVPTRVFGYEYLLAIMAETGRAKDRARLQVSLDSKPADESKLNDILERHHLHDKWRKIAI